MRNIQHLPESVHSSVRSGIILSDLTRVVEELIFNSLDAGASKISVAVGVGTCYAKVVDNGSGITRDGLVLLGERYATSKLDQPDGIDAVTGGFGCRGESLSSISDVSLLEIITKSHGRPNGYRKVIKGCKCMYLGIDDNRQDVGTTVIVRDLYYNQPVRRKHMQSSPKKVLHSVKKCVLRIALVHPEVLFKVIDTESENELLCTYPSRSPLSLLTSGFGSEVSNTLHELNVSDGALKLSGYLSAPRDTFSVKAFQYIYINSRYICKGPLHKLLNQLATRFNSANIWKANIGSENGKRSRSQTYATYVLNLRCPRSCYALTFEPSKTSVEFKDWAPILNFIEESVIHFWSENTSYGDSLSHGIDMSTKDNTWKEGDSIVSSREALPGKHEVAEKRRRFSVWKSLKKTSEFEDHHTTGFGYAYEEHYPYQSSYEPFAQFRMKVDPEDNILGNKLSASENSGVDVDNILGCILEDDCLNDGSQSFDDHKVVDDNQNFDLIPRTLWPDTTASTCSSPIYSIKSNLHRGLDLLSKDSIKSSSIGGKCFDDENDLLPDSLTQIGEFVTRHQSFGTDWSSVMFDPLFGAATPDLDHFSHDNALERHGTYFDSAKYDTLRNSSRRGNWSLSVCTNICSDYKVHAGSGEDISEFLEGPKLDNVLFPNSSNPWNNEIGKFHLGSPRENFANKFAAPWHRNPAPVYLEKDVNLMDQQIYQEENYVRKKGSIRSHSAPPFYRGRKKFFVLNNQLTTKEGKLNSQIFSDAHTLGETGELVHPQPSYPTSHLQSEPSFGEGMLFDIRQNMTQDALEIEECKMTKKSKGHEISNTKSVEDFKSNEQITKDFMSREFQDPLDSGLKWRNKRPQIANGIRTHPHCNEDFILDISSGLLHLAGGESLVPKSVTKKLLEDAKVLQQVDKKFIPVVSGGVLALIDQHAADERIRLEELRQKVLSGEMKTITYLDAEQELVLPEIGNQLLHIYAEQIQSWGWICNIHAQASRSFKMNLNLLHRHRPVVTLLAVPCILGVNLTDVDLLEFLQQLADTDGSSTMPPSVLRVLNFKACRGAIMFGDTLLPSECSLIVEELKQTSLCFQCAHGRPTTAPLVNLGALHKQIAKHGLLNGGSNEPWHGLLRHEVSLERAAMRFTSSGGPS